VKKILTIAMTGILSFSIIGTSIQTADAGKRERRIAVGLAIGIIGAAIAINEHKKLKKEKRRNRQRVNNSQRARYYNANSRYTDERYRFDDSDYYDDRSFDDDYYERPAPRRVGRVFRLSRAHANWCQNQYRSYRKWDNTFQPYHGARRACFSPYN